MTNQTAMQIESLRASSTRRWWWAIAVMILVSLCSVGWALTIVLSPADDPLESTSFTYVTVAPGQVGSTVALQAVAEWAAAPAGENRAVGVVTSVVLTPGAEVSQGSVLYTVDLRPVVVAQGEIPSFRAITRGTIGRDVGQLQRMLGALGFYAGPDDGEAGASTVAAVEAWQASNGVERTGVVEQGDVLFIPTLPSRLALDAELISRGATLSGGEHVVLGLSQAPTFTIPVTEPQSRMMPQGTRVEIDNPDGEAWVGVVSGQSNDEETGTVVVTLSATDGAPVCGQGCAAIPVTGRSQFASQVVTVEPVAGLVVPSAALVTAADGTVAVIDADGKRVPVSVTAAARGMSVIEGAAEGTRVRVPAGQAR